MASGNRTRKVSTAGSAGMTTVILNRVRVRNLMAKTIRESSVNGRHSSGPERQPDGGVILELNKAIERARKKSAKSGDLWVKAYADPPLKRASLTKVDAARRSQPPSPPLPELTAEQKMRSGEIF
jgi:hypothetical protein